jgi:HJR/Mrr/RecB family endonuclease
MRNILKNANQKYIYFRKYHKIFPDNRFYTLHDYCDIYLNHFGKRYRTYLYPFYELLKLRRINFGTDCYIKELLWNKIKTGNYKDFIPKRNSNINIMTGIQFEVFLAKFFTHCGYQVDKTPYTNDKGADLIMKKGFSTCVVQAKRYKKAVGSRAVRDVYAAKTIYQADKAMVITNSKFSRQVVKDANELNIELWDGERLKNKLRSYNYY